jgi:hypothetical protein
VCPSNCACAIMLGGVPACTTGGPAEDPCDANDPSCPPGQACFGFCQEICEPEA